MFFSRTAVFGLGGKKLDRVEVHQAQPPCDSKKTPLVTKYSIDFVKTFFTAYSVPWLIDEELF